MISFPDYGASRRTDEALLIELGERAYTALETPKRPAPGDPVVVVSGLHVGQRGHLHEIDADDPDLPYGVEFGSLLVWFGRDEIAAVS